MNPQSPYSAWWLNPRGPETIERYIWSVTTSTHRLAQSWIEHGPDTHSPYPGVLGRPIGHMTPNKWVWLQAAAQHAGCGQGEKSFFSPPGGLYTSLMCLWPTMSVAPPLSLVVALAVAKVLGTVCTLKWVNDVYWGDKKICGVLIHRYWGKTHHPCIISFGLNINALGEKTPDNREITSLIHHTGRSHDIHQIYSAIQDQIFAYFKEIIAHDGALSPNLCQSLNNRLTAYGKKVRIQTQDGQVTGWCHGLAPSGRIILDSGHEYDVIGLGIVNEMRL